MNAPPRKAVTGVVYRIKSVCPHDAVGGVATAWSPLFARNRRSLGIHRHYGDLP